MSFYNDISLNYLQGKSVYPEVRRIISLLLKISISTYAFTFFFGEFKVFEFSEYKKIIDFFLSGKFFIPLSVFIITHLVIYIIQFLIFQLFTFSPLFRLKKKIVDYKLTNEDKEAGKNAVKRLVKYTIKKDVSDEKLSEVYVEYKTKMSKDVNAELEISEDLESELNEPKANAQSHFNMSVLILISLFVFYFNIPNFPIALFVIVLVITISFTFGSIVYYRFLDILPTILLKIPEVLEEQKDESEIKNEEV